jgi:hypothetical protein
LMINRLRGVGEYEHHVPGRERGGGFGATDQLW